MVPSVSGLTIFESELARSKKVGFASYSLEGNKLLRQLEVKLAQLFEIYNYTGAHIYKDGLDIQVEGINCEELCVFLSKLDEHKNAHAFLKKFRDEYVLSA